jgi:hypothetical protein
MGQGTGQVRQGRGDCKGLGVGPTVLSVLSAPTDNTMCGFCSQSCTGSLV